MRAGAPAAVTLSGMERITAEPAPTMLQAPIMICGMTDAPVPT